MSELAKQLTCHRVARRERVGDGSLVGSERRDGTNA